ncbi:hypothetical protein DM02DRAFT_368950 [Periconia macrospinosa]|uniref:Uncharacterized protein n=1 Tax=Periconia macrospinosa TaxID=97972 RepID=A0A2V1DW32_9PLEO|nr:hypothetical protein DM02DRAFT_368950 [Periconia macrospinosa]
MRAYARKIQAAMDKARANGLKMHADVRDEDPSSTESQDSPSSNKASTEAQNDAPSEETSTGQQNNTTSKETSTKPQNNTPSEETSTAAGGINATDSTSSIPAAGAGTQAGNTTVSTQPRPILGTRSRRNLAPKSRKVRFEDPVPTSPVPTSTVPMSTVPTSTVPMSTVPTSTIPTSTVPTSTVPTITAPTSVERPSNNPFDFQPSRTPTRNQHAGNKTTKRVRLSPSPGCRN